MSFRCGACGLKQPAGVKPHRVVTQKRKRTYPDGSEGWEIVKEKNLCDTCFRVHVKTQEPRNGNKQNR